MSDRNQASQPSYEMPSEGPDFRQVEQGGAPQSEPRQPQQEQVWQYRQWDIVQSAGFQREHGR